MGPLNDNDRTPDEIVRAYLTEGGQQRTPAQPMTIRVQSHVIEQLDELAEDLGTTRSALATELLTGSIWQALRAYAEYTNVEEAN